MSKRCISAAKQWTIRFFTVKFQGTIIKMFQKRTLDKNLSNKHGYFFLLVEEQNESKDQWGLIMPHFSNILTTNS